MTPEERQMLAGLFERIGSAASTTRDPQAEAFINDAVRAQPYAPYVLAQTVLVQQQALENASRRLAELEAQARAAPPQETSFLGNLGKSLFGGGQPAAPPPQRPTYAPDPAYQRPQGGYAPPQPGYAPPQPGYAPPPPQAQGGPWGAPQAAAPGGGGFLQSALTTAAGVAGGVVLANSLGSLFGGGHSGSGASGLTGAKEETVVNNYYEGSPESGGEHADHAEHFADDPQDHQDMADDVSYDDADAGNFDDSGSYDT